MRNTAENSSVIGTVPISLQSAFQQARRSPHLALAGIVLLALVIRLYQIGHESLWVDEWLTLRDAHHIQPHNRHRPLFYLLLRPWLFLGGGDVWARLPAVFFGVAAIILLYLVGRRLASLPAALLACLFMAIAVPELNHSQEVRMYTLASMLTLASVYCLLEWVQSTKLWVLAIQLIITYLAFLTTPTVIFGLLLAGGIGGLVLVIRRRWAAALATFVGYGLIALAWLPLKRYAKLALFYGSLDWITRPSPSALFFLHGSILTGNLGGVRGLDVSQAFQIGVSLLASACVVAALVGCLRREPAARLAWLIAAWFYAIAVAMYATSLLKQPVWTLRYFHYAAPALYLLLGIGVVSILRWLRSLGWLAGATLLLMTAIAATDYYRLPVREDWQGAADSLALETARGDMIAIVGPGGLFQRYYHGPATVCEISPRWWEMPQKSGEVLTEMLAQIKPHIGRTWVLVREDPRLERVGLFSLLEQYLRGQGMPAHVRVFRTVEGQLDVVDFSQSPGTSQLQTGQSVMCAFPPREGLQIGFAQ